MLPSTLTKLTVQSWNSGANLHQTHRPAGSQGSGGTALCQGRVGGRSRRGRPCPDDGFPGSCFRVDEYEAADGSVRNHGITLCKLDSQTVAVRNQLHDVLLQCVVRTACVPCCRLDYLHPFDAGTGKLFLELGVDPAGNGLCKSDFDGAQEHGLV